MLELRRTALHFLHTQYLLILPKSILSPFLHPIHTISFNCSVSLALELGLDLESRLMIWPVKPGCGDDIKYKIGKRFILSDGSM